MLAQDESIRTQLREFDFLTVDSRRKERKKYGQKGARRKFPIRKTLIHVSYQQTYFA